MSRGGFRWGEFGPAAWGHGWQGVVEGAAGRACRVVGATDERLVEEKALSRSRDRWASRVMTTVLRLLTEAERVKPCSGGSGGSPRGGADGSYVLGLCRAIWAWSHCCVRGKRGFVVVDISALRLRGGACFRPARSRCAWYTDLASSYGEPLMGDVGAAVQRRRGPQRPRRRPMRGPDEGGTRVGADGVACFVGVGGGVAVGRGSEGACGEGGRAWLQGRDVLWGAPRRRSSRSVARDGALRRDGGATGSVSVQRHQPETTTADKRSTHWARSAAWRGSTRDLFAIRQGRRAGGGAAASYVAAFERRDAAVQRDGRF